MSHTVEEYVSSGHPDKVADQISDAILDEFLKIDPYSRVACETLVTNNLVVVAGEISSKGSVDVEIIIRRTLCDIGYDTFEAGLDGMNCEVVVNLKKQSLELNRIVSNNQANDQSIVIGFASHETSTYLPLGYSLARDLISRLGHVREKSNLLLPDAKSQVVLKAVNGEHCVVSSITLSPQHRPDMTEQQLRNLISKDVVEVAIPSEYLNEMTALHVFGFTEGGPSADTGLTGRKIVIDSYGNTVPHGGGAFSGKDPSKVDRSGAYFARYLAKNVVAHGIANRCLVRIGYTKSLSQPVLFEVYTGSASSLILDGETTALLTRTFPDMSPNLIGDRLNLYRPIYLETSRIGHFGFAQYPWEKVDLF